MQEAPWGWGAGGGVLGPMDIEAGGSVLGPVDYGTRQRCPGPGGLWGQVEVSWGLWRWGHD